MEILGEIQSSEGREEELQAVLQSEDRSSVLPSGPSENATSALDEPSSGIQTEETSFQSPIQQSENLEDLDNLISAASCRRKVILKKFVTSWLSWTLNDRSPNDVFCYYRN